MNLPDSPLLPAAAALAAYAIGCANAAYYGARWRAGVDIRATGSGNAGARNAGRLMGKRGFAAVLLFDAAKGAAAVALSRWAFAAGEVGEALAAVSVVAGHVWPAQLGFRGGRGVAPSLGAFAIVAPWALAGIVAGFAVAWLSGLKRFTLAGLVGYAVAPVGVALAEGWSVACMATLAVSALVVAAHAPNLRSVRGRREPRKEATA